MKLATSYYYQIRFFKNYMIPVSTTVWDPDWYHDFKGSNHIFIDKRGVYNGIRYDELSPGLICQGLCNGPKGCTATPDCCKFLKEYNNQLLKLDCNLVYNNLLELSNRLSNINHFNNEPIVVLMFYESPNNKCSERSSIKNYFESNGISCDELNYPIDKYYK